MSEPTTNAPPIVLVHPRNARPSPRVGRRRRDEALTETYEFPDRSHFTGLEPGWEQVADYTLQWATSHARTRQS